MPVFSALRSFRLCVNLIRKSKRPVSPKLVQEIVKDYLSWHVVVNDGESILAALEIQERYGTSFWDALVIHSAHVAGVEILYSEDFSAGQLYGSVRVVNPLRE